MSTKSKVSKKTSSQLAIIFFLPSILLFISYSAVGIKYGYMSETARKETLLDLLPSWMQNYSVIVIVALIFTILAIYYASRGYKRKLLSARIINLMIVLISIFLILFYLSQLF